jgi:hypothetical protein
MLNEQMLRTTAPYRHCSMASPFCGRGHARLPLTTRQFKESAMPDENQKIIDEWRRKEGEVWRVEVHTYHGVRQIGIRAWTKLEDGGFRPTRDGVTMRAHNVPRLAAALAKAEEFLRGEGTLDDGGAA